MIAFMAGHMQYYSSWANLSLYGHMRSLSRALFLLLLKIEVPVSIVQPWGCSLEWNWPLPHLSNSSGSKCLSLLSGLGDTHWSGTDHCHCPGVHCPACGMLSRYRWLTDVWPRSIIGLHSDGQPILSNLGVNIFLLKLSYWYYPRWGSAHRTSRIAYIYSNFTVTENLNAAHPLPLYILILQ